jgi:hypothetical protein
MGSDPAWNSAPKMNQCQIFHTDCGEVTWSADGSHNVTSLLCSSFLYFLSVLFVEGKNSSANGRISCMFLFFNRSMSFDWFQAASGQISSRLSRDWFVGEPTRPSRRLPATPVVDATPSASLTMLAASNGRLSMQSANGHEAAASQLRVSYGKTRRRWVVSLTHHINI